MALPSKVLISRWPAQPRTIFTASKAATRWAKLGPGVVEQVVVDLEIVPALGDAAAAATRKSSPSGLKFIRCTWSSTTGQPGTSARQRKAKVSALIGSTGNSIPAIAATRAGRRPGGVDQQATGDPRAVCEDRRRHAARARPSRSRRPRPPGIPRPVRSPCAARPGAGRRGRTPPPAVAEHAEADVVDAHPGKQRLQLARLEDVGAGAEAALQVHLGADFLAALFRQQAADSSRASGPSPARCRRPPGSRAPAR